MSDDTPNEVRDVDARALDAHKLHVDSGLRFDYFVTGGAGVTLAYSLKEFTPAMGPVAVFLLPVAWIALLLAMFFGLAQLYASRSSLQLQPLRLAMMAEARMLRVCHRDGKAAEIVDTGQVLVGEEMVLAIRQRDDAIDKNLEDSRKLRNTMTGTSLARNVSLMTGFGALALWRILNLLATM